MKAFQLNVARIVAIICCALIGIVEVSGILRKHKASDGREYLIETEKKYNWFEASNECTRRNSQLLIIDSEEKNTVIVNLLKDVVGGPRNLWLSGNDQFINGDDRSFFWSATGQKFTFTNWFDGEPNNSGDQEHCVHFLGYSYHWNANNCQFKFGFICEDNRYVDMYKLNYNTKLNSDIFLKIERLQKDHMNQLKTKLQTLEEIVKDGKAETQKLQNVHESSRQQLIDQQELTAKNLWEKVQKQGNELNEQIVQSMTQINDNFDEKFNASISSPYSYRNVVVIKQ